MLGTRGEGEGVSAEIVWSRKIETADPFRLRFFIRLKRLPTQNVDMYKFLAGELIEDVHYFIRGENGKNHDQFRFSEPCHVYECSIGVTEEEEKLGEAGVISITPPNMARMPEIAREIEGRLKEIEREFMTVLGFA